MITILEQPSAISLSRNDIILHFLAEYSAGVPYGATGVSASVSFNNDGFPVGNILKLDWTTPEGSAQSLSFEAAADPSNALEIPAKPSNLSNTDYVIAVAEKIQAHPYLYPYFSIKVESTPLVHTIKATAKDLSNDWQVSWDTSSLSSTINPVTSTAAIIPDTTPSNYELELEIFFEKNYKAGNYESVAKVYGKPDADGNIVFNIMDILNDETKLSFTGPPLPAFGEDQPFIANNIRQYYFLYSEKHDGAPASTPVFSSIKRVLCGGIAQQLFADYNFFDAFDETNALLSWYPDKKMISPDQPEWLAWYNYLDREVAIMLFVKTYDENGLVGDDYYYNADPLVVRANEVALIPVGYNQLAIGGTDVLKYEVSILEFIPSRPQLAQVRSFYVDHRYREEKRYVMYLNGFSVPQTLRCIGYQSNDLKVARSKREQTLSPDYQSVHTQTSQYKESFDNYFTFRSGYISKREQDALQELLIYNQAYEVYAEGYMPIDLTDSKFKITETRQELHALEFKAVPRLKAKNYSNINIPMNTEQAGWRTSWNEYYRTVFGQTWKIS